MKAPTAAPLAPIDADDPRWARLIHHAARAFIATGYDAVRVEEIAAAAGIGKATVYRMVDSKAELLDIVMEHATRHMLDACRVRLDPKRPAEAMLTEFGEIYITAMYRPFAGGLPYYQVARLMIATSFARPDDMRKFTGAYFEAGVTLLAAYLTARVDAEELPTLDADEAAVTFFQLIFYTDQAIAFAETAPPADAIAALAARRVRQFLYGVSASAAVSPSG